MDENDFFLKKCHMKICTTIANNSLFSTRLISAYKFNKLGLDPLQKVF
jgi:hypothetical protein